MHLYNTLTDQVELFTPIVENEITMYVCGATVQSEPHIGHLRSAVVFDTMRRWFEYNYEKVTFVRNITDIDDKILEKASANEQWWEVANRVEKEFHQAYDMVGVRKPTVEPKVTGHIYEIMDFIRVLENLGFAYMESDGIYFNISKLNQLNEEFQYGKISKHVIEEVQSHDGKSDADFALWKFAKPGEPESAHWESDMIPSGRPGWHIECSAMSKKYLGRNFDIHGGGLDLKFPHHENEKAQSNAIGDKFANYWVHNGLITVDGQKMSKSLNNFITAHEYIEKITPIVARYELLSSHYRSSMDVSDQKSSESRTALYSILNFLHLGRDVTEEDTELPEDFVKALNNDLNTPIAISVIHELVTEANSILGHTRSEKFRVIVRKVRAMMNILGFGDILIDHSKSLYGALDEIVSIRDTMRADKNYEVSDRIRDNMAKYGISIDDSEYGSSWRWM